MSLTDRPLAAGAALLYLAAVLTIGILASRRTRDARDFYIAGQNVGLVVTAFATMTAAFSGFVFVGGPGLTYRLGLSSLFINLPVAFTGGLLCWTVATRLRRLAERPGIYTVPDALLCRFGSRLVSGLASVAVLAGTVGYLGAQIQALGVVTEVALAGGPLGASGPGVGLAVGLTVVLAYSVGGGMVAGVYTDLLQGVVMLVSAVAVFVCALAAAGGLAGISRSIAASEAFGPSFLDPLGGVPLATAFGFYFVFGVGVLGQPHMLHKFYMIDEPAKLRWFPAILGASQSLCLLIWLGIGVAVPALVAQGRMAPLGSPDEAAPAFLLNFTPEILAGLVFAGILAAIMSTADSFINIGAAVLVRDIPIALGRPPAGDGLARGRAASLGVAITATLVALVYRDLVALLGTFAFGTFAAALAPVMAVGIAWRRVPARAAAASIGTGLVLNLGLEVLAKQTLWPALPRPPLPAGVLPSAVALAASFTILFAVTAVDGLRAAGTTAEAAAGPFPVASRTTDG